MSRSGRFIRENFGGSTNIILPVTADGTQTLLNPQTLIALDELSAYLIERVPRVTKATGFTDMVKRMNQLFNADESPSGITAGVAVNSAMNYGLTENDFGFGDFGFDNFNEEGGSLPLSTS